MAAIAGRPRNGGDGLVVYGVNTPHWLSPEGPIRVVESARRGEFAWTRLAVVDGAGRILASAPKARREVIENIAARLHGRWLREPIRAARVKERSLDPDPEPYPKYV